MYIHLSSKPSLFTCIVLKPFVRITSKCNVMHANSFNITYTNGEGLDFRLHIVGMLS